MREQLLDDQERHLVLGMTTLEQLMSRREERTHAQNNNKSKPEQLKFSKTYPST
jgi:hypothetical protein